MTLPGAYLRAGNRDDLRTDEVQALRRTSGRLGSAGLSTFEIVVNGNLPFLLFHLEDTNPPNGRR